MAVEAAKPNEHEIGCVTYWEPGNARALITGVVTFRRLSRFSYEQMHTISYKAYLLCTGHDTLIARVTATFGRCRAKD